VNLGKDFSEESMPAEPIDGFVELQMCIRQGDEIAFLFGRSHSLKQST
jgi:hypothetical protein